MLLLNSLFFSSLFFLYDLYLYISYERVDRLWSDEFIGVLNYLSINPNFVFNGDRIAFSTVIERNKSTT